MAHAQVIEKLYAALGDGVPGAERVADQFTPDFELHEFQGGPDRTVYRGRDGVVAWVAQGFEVFGEATFEPVELLEDGDVVLATVEVRAVGLGSGATVRMVVHHVWDMRDGQPCRVRGYLDEAEARQAAGVA